MTEAPDDATTPEETPAQPVDDETVEAATDEATEGEELTPPNSDEPPLPEEAEPAEEVAGEVEVAGVVDDPSSAAPAPADAPSEAPASPSASEDTVSSADATPPAEAPAADAPWFQCQTDGLASPNCPAFQSDAHLTDAPVVCPSCGGQTVLPIEPPATA